MNGGGRLEIAADRARAGRHLLLGLAFVALSLWIAVTERPELALLPEGLLAFITVYVGTPFFALVSIYNLWLATGRRLLLIVDETGVAIRHPLSPVKEIPWSAIQEASIHRRKMHFNRVTFLVIDLVAPEAFLALHLSLWRRMLFALSRPWWGDAVAIMVDGLDIDSKPEGLAVAIRERRQRSGGEAKPS